MTRAQEVKQLELNDLYTRIFKGSIPRLYADEAIDPEIFYRSYKALCLGHFLKAMYSRKSAKAI